MSLPTSKTSSAQTSIRSFFQPKAPKYAPPPSSQAAKSPGAPPAPQQQQQPPKTTTTIPLPPSSTPPTVFAATAPHPQATIRPAQPEDIPALRRINALLLPVSYPDTFYASILDPSISALFSRVITWTDKDKNKNNNLEKVVGGIVCRIETLATPSAQLVPEQEEHVLYIQSLCLLSPYRALGLASASLDQVLSAAARDPSLNVRSAYAHVWTENADGLRWYKSRGFVQEGDAVEGYYLKLRPNTAWVVRRDVVLPAIRGAASASAAMSSTPQQQQQQQQGIVQPTPLHVPQSTTAAVANFPPPPPPPPSSRGPSSAPPPRSTPPTRTTSGQSYQNQGPGMEWNDLPADMAPGLKPNNGSGPSSGQSSRSSSAVRKKRDRAYPAAAFGS